MLSIFGISSMATKAVLAELTRAYDASARCRVVITSVGGVDAARRVEAGGVFDVVVLARDAIDKLLAAGHLVAGSRVDLMRSGVAVAVRAGAPRPDISSEDGVTARGAGGAHRSASPPARAAYSSAGCSSAGSIADEIRARIVTPTPGVPVARLVASGEVELGFQQLSELIRLGGIDVIGPLPAPIQIVTTFSAAVGARARQPEEARALLAFMASPAAANAKRREGMEPA